MTTTPVPSDSERHLPPHHSPLPEMSEELPVHPNPAAFTAMQKSPEFGELRSRFRRFAFPMTVVFLAWYFLFVLLSVYATDFMSSKVWGNITIGLILGLLQFVSTFLITWLYIRHANRNLDPIATKLRDQLEQGATR